MVVAAEDDDDIDEGMDSADEALCEMLGISSFSPHSKDKTPVQQEVNKRSDSLDGELLSSSPDHVTDKSKETVLSIIQKHSLSEKYAAESVCCFPSELSVPSHTMKRITDELVWGSDKYPSDRTYEPIKFIRKQSAAQPHCPTTDSAISDDCDSTVVRERQELTRLENFVNAHPTWNQLCHNHFANSVSALVGEEMVLFKEKLNLKPSGGSGFAPHVDTPSLRVALGKRGPQTFVTLMVAIDDMNERNGCLRLVHGDWSEPNHCVDIDTGEIDDDNKRGKNPDSDGRQGAISEDIYKEQTYRDLICRGGSMAMFNGWTPHRSSGNVSCFPRRAVFLTYNPLREGDFHDLYYVRMTQLRDDFRRSVLNDRRRGEEMNQENIRSELAAFSTVPI